MGWAIVNFGMEEKQTQQNTKMSVNLHPMCLVHVTCIPVIEFYLNCIEHGRFVEKHNYYYDYCSIQAHMEIC